MDTLTHALSGALAARAAGHDSRHRVSPRECLALGFLACAFPDADVLIAFASPLAYLYHHRGATHSVLLLPLWAFVLAWVWSRLRRNPAGLRAYFAICALALAMHILGDLITAFGTMIYAPFSDARIAWGTTFIIDPWFTGIVVAGLLASWVLRRSRLPAVAGLALLCGYVGFQWLQRERAVDVGAAFARDHGIDRPEVSALPRPVSPFNWMVIVAEPERFHHAFVNLRRTQPRAVGPDAGFVARLDSHYLPAGSARWQSISRFGAGADRELGKEAWAQDAFEFFRWFAAYPVVAQVERGNPSECVWFQDLRFLTPGRDDWPFRYGMCREAGGRWDAYQPGANGEPRRVSAG